MKTQVIESGLEHHHRAERTEGYYLDSRERTIAVAAVGVAAGLVIILAGCFAVLVLG